jgi:hypothetical protein
MKSTDLNGDSFPDLYISGAGTNGNKTLKILWNDGSGTFSSLNPILIYESGAINYQLRVFPNPFHNYVNIEIPQTYTSLTSITIYDLYGRLVKKFTEVETHNTQHLLVQWDGCTITGSSCPPGIYFTTIILDSHRYTKKVVKL